MLDLTRHEGELERQYLWRVGGYVEEGKCTWKEITPIINQQWRESEDLYRDESAYRKPRQSAALYYQDVFSKMIDNQYSQEIAEQKRELEQAKIQFRDERVAWNKQNFVAARVQQKMDYLETCMADLGKTNFEVVDTPKINSDNDMLIMLTDLHIGQTFSSTFGEYNSDIAKVRLTQYLNEIIKIQKRHNSENAFVSIQGDLISSSIHKTLAVTNRENVIKQVELAIDMVSAFCYELTKHFNHVYMTDCSGNHSRIDRKEDSLHDERLDDLIGWSVAKFLEHIENFSILNQKLDIGIAMLNIRDKSYIATHGDFDDLSKSGISSLILMLGYIPYGILMGHRHYSALTDNTGIRVIQGGSLAGSGDQYTIEKRLSGKPSQTVCICTNNGIECMYPIVLN